MPELSWADVLFRVALAAVLGGAVGAEREFRDREAGLRTHLLVAVGAALFTLVSAYGFADFRYGLRSGITVDPTRIAAQIVSGIGFLGAGAIIRQGLAVRGLTTAATLWAVAAIGMAAGAGYYGGAVITTVIVLVSLWPLRILAYRLFSRLRAESGQLTVEFPAGSGSTAVVGALEGLGGRLRSLEFDEAEGRRRVVASVELPPGARGADVVARLMEYEEVLAAEWAD